MEQPPGHCDLLGIGLGVSRSWLILIPARFQHGHVATSAAVSSADFQNARDSGVDMLRMIFFISPLDIYRSPRTEASAEPSSRMLAHVPRPFPRTRAYLDRSCCELASQTLCLSTFAFEPGAVGAAVEIVETDDFPTRRTKFRKLFGKCFW